MDKKQGLSTKVAQKLTEKEEAVTIYGKTFKSLWRFRGMKIVIFVVANL